MKTKQSKLNSYRFPRGRRKNMKTATVAPDLRNFSPSLATPATSKASLVAVSIDAKKAVASASMPIKSYIPQGYTIRGSHPEASTIVIRPFIVDITLTETETEYIATDTISNVYELGTTPAQA